MTVPGHGDEAPRVLIVADNASFSMGGEAARPVHYFRTLRRRGVGVWLCVHARCRDELTRVLGDDVERVRFVEDTPLHKALWKVGQPFPHHFRVSTFGAAITLLTQREQNRIAREMIAAHGIELVHQPTPISPRQPSGIYGLGVPVVIGPMNGNMRFPPAFDHMENGFERVAVVFGKALNPIANRLVPGKHEADVLLVSNDRTAEALPAGHRGKVVHLVANAVDLGEWDAPAGRAPNEKPRFAFLGRLVALKMVDKLLEAFVPVARAHGAHLDIVGEGVVRGDLEAQAARLGIADHVTFHGWQSYRDSAAILAGSDALVFPSLRDCGGAVVMEAMAVGTPVIAADWGGPADYVGDASDDSGLLVSPDSEAGFVAGLTEAMERLAASPELVRRMSARARERAMTEFHWDARVDRLLEIYREAIAAYRQRGA